MVMGRHMSRKQGRDRLIEGATRPLTRHEVARGYVYVSTDKKIGEVLDVSSFSVDLNGTVLTNRRLDVSGRVHVPKRLLECIGLEKPVTVRLVSNDLIEITLVGGD